MLTDRTHVRFFIEQCRDRTAGPKSGPEFWSENDF